ncbi:MAG: NAD(P)/FAD-dependent oxidoreductase [Rhodospirillaceae bacterium]
MTRVCVIGGGPAGAVFAARMAALGHAVTLVEQATFPRRRLGEALTPGLRPLLDTIGAGDAIDRAGGLPIARVHHLWDGAALWRDDPSGLGWTVDRGRLDALLIDAARKAGAEVLQPARVLEQVETEAGWSLVLATPEGIVRREADFVAHATGRGGRAAAEAPRTVAVHAYWRVPGPMPPSCIEAGAAAWFWGVPLPGGLYNTLVVCRPDTLRAAGGRTLEERLSVMLAASRLLPDLSGARRDGPVGAADATPRRATDPVGPRFIRIGDAALSLDPISSSGVQKAVQGALAAAVTANTLLRRPERCTAAVEFYTGSLRRTAVRHRHWTLAHYASAAATRPHAFWQERAAGAAPAEDAPRLSIDDQMIRMQPVRLAPETEIRLSPCLDDEYVALRPAVTHPRLDGPLAYLGGHEIAPLLARWPVGATPLELARTWGDRLPLKTALAIIVRLMESGVIVPASPEPARTQT